MPVEDAHESHRLRRRIAAKGEADTAPVLVDLGGGLALADAWLNAVARVGADRLDGEGQQRLRLDHAHFGAARNRKMCEPSVGLRGAGGGAIGGWVTRAHLMDIRRARLPPAVGVPPFFAGATGSASSTPATDSRRARKSALFCPPAGAFAGAFLQCQEEAGTVSRQQEPEVGSEGVRTPTFSPTNESAPTLSTWCVGEFSPRGSFFNVHSGKWVKESKLSIARTYRCPDRCTVQPVASGMQPVASGM